MLSYKVAAASAALCSWLLLASYLKAAEVDPAALMKAPAAQMNRVSYDR